MTAGRAHFDQARYEEAAAAFAEAASDPALAPEATAFLERTEVLLGRRPATAWRIEPSRAGDPVMALRITVEVRWLLGEARRLAAAGHYAEADLRVSRAKQLIQEAEFRRPMLAGP